MLSCGFEDELPHSGVVGRLGVWGGCRALFSMGCRGTLRVADALGQHNHTCVKTHCFGWCWVLGFLLALTHGRAEGCLILRVEEGGGARSKGGLRVDEDQRMH